METFIYKPQGVCSREMRFEMDGDIIRHVTIVGGCPGNLLGISRILENKTIDEVIDALVDVEKRLPSELRCATTGGLACTATACRLRENLEKKSNKK